MRSFRKVVLLAAVVAMAVSCSIVQAQETESKGKKQALIRLLVRAGKTEEAAAAMRSLYPKGPPSGGPLALEYYDVIGNTDGGWQEAKDGLEKLVKAAPDELSYQLALAKHLSRRAETRRRGLEMFASLANKPGVDNKEVLKEWRDALDKLEYVAASIPWFKAYLAVDPDNATVQDYLAGAQRAEAARLPWQLRDKADAQLQAGHPEQAMDTLQRALVLDPKNAWVRFDLARLYHKRGDPKHGRALMEAGLTAAPGDADMQYANALYVSLLDEPGQALRLLDKISPEDRSPAMKELRKKMQVTLQTEQAEAAARENRRGEMQVAMHRAEAIAGKDPELTYVVANAWIDLNDPARGVTLMQRSVRQPAQKGALISYAKVLNRADRTDQLGRVLGRLDAEKGLTPGEKEDLRYLHAQLDTHRADALRHEGRLAEARSVLGQGLKRDPENIDMQMALARVYVASGEEEQAREIYQRILQNNPAETGARRALEGMTAAESAKAKAQVEAQVQAQQRAQRAAAQGDEVGARLAVADGYIGLGDTAAAHTIIDQLQQTAPNDPRVLVQAGRLARAEGNYEEALEDFRRANAQDEIVQLERSRGQGYFSAGVDYLSKLNGVDGISNLTIVELPVEVRVPVGFEGGRLFAQVDHAYADAGVLQPGDLYDLRQYGKVQALAPNGIAGPVGQSARGTAGAIGYDRDGLRVDIGSTPVGFPVSTVVGGVKYSNYTEVSGFSMDVSRRPVNNSVVSYAGARDPVTGEVWGGVVATGVGLHFSHDIGPLTGYVEPGYYSLTGQNVLSNAETAVRAGFNWNFIERDDMRLTAGLVGTYWHYNENERFYTFGMGGYYSPQKYYSAALPARWTGRTENWSYMLQGSVSMAVSHEKDMPYYPASPALQAQAIANTGVAGATYTGGISHSTGFSLGGALEHRISPQLFGGVLGQIDRSAYYTPNYAIFYLRYTFEPQSAPMNFPPEPIKAYSRF